MSNKYKNGFTLAEVLITLGIIGVVAAITIPTLVSSYQKVQYVTGLKKAYAQLNQVIIQFAADQGCPGDLRCTGLFNTGVDQNTLGKEFVKYFKVSRDCDVQMSTGCFSNTIINDYVGNASTGGLDDDRYKFIALDGIAYRVNNFSDGCTTNWSISGTGPLTSICGSVNVDVNGSKAGPNRFGRDIFSFYITNAKGPMLYPAGGTDIVDGVGGYWNSPSHLSCQEGHPDGTTCAGRIMEQGWEMNY